jgi:Protein of unknown function (DUF1592)
MPDAELMAVAFRGELKRPEMLVRQARRMLKDERARGLATEFGGAWLDFRRFEELNTVDRERFPVFDNDLRRAMYEEPIRFMLDLFRENRPVLDFLYASHTFVNPVLAKHYGIPNVTGDSEAWIRVDDANKVRAGRFASHVGVSDEERAGLTDKPGETRVLGCEAGAGRAHTASAGCRPGIAARRSEDRSAAARSARPSSSEP